MNVTIRHQCRPHPHESESGDIAIVECLGPVTLFGIVDVLGHGPEAAEVARRAAWLLRDLDFQVEPLAKIVDALHRGLERTRGAAATLCRFEGSELEIAGIGNVGARAEPMRLGLHCVPGILGRRAIAPKVDARSPSGGTRLAVFSDGIRGSFELHDYGRLDPDAACRSILREHGKDTDDATILIADFDEGPAS